MNGKSVLTTEAMNTQPTVTECVHIGLVVEDLDETIQFLRSITLSTPLRSRPSQANVCLPVTLIPMSRFREKSRPNTQGSAEQQKASGDGGRLDAGGEQGLARAGVLGPVAEERCRRGH
jgi:hypothetical protein